MLAGEYKLNKTDKVGLSLSSPLSVVKGRASLMYAGGRDNHSDTIYMPWFLLSGAAERRCEPDGKG